MSAARQRRQHAADEVSPPGNPDRRSGYAESGRQAARQLIEQIAGSVEPRQIVIPAALN
jgi:DNA-binding LacI/PurR family transcriptional regulator